MKLEIEVDEILYPTLQRIAQENKLSPKIYARNIVQTFLEKQYRGQIMDELKITSVEKLKNIKEQLNSLKK